MGFMDFQMDLRLPDAGDPTRVKPAETLLAGGVAATYPAFQQGDGGSIPTPAIRSLRLIQIPFKLARRLLESYHYLHSMAGGTQLALGVWFSDQLVGVLTFGVGPINASHLANGLDPFDVFALTRFWLSDALPTRSESRVLGIALAQLKRNTSLRMVVTYADPVQGHVGTIYQASNWLYTGVTQESTSLDLGDGVLRHSRTVGHAYGTHSVAYLRKAGLDVTTITNPGKHRYVYPLDPTVTSQLTVPTLPYPKKEEPE